jgi:hypothetical protein
MRGYKMIRLRSTGEYIAEGEFRRMHSDVPLPIDLTQDLIDELDADIVHDSPVPLAGEYEYVALEGIYQSETDGRWYKKYVVKPSYVEFIDDNGVVQTVEMQIAARKEMLANCTCEACVDARE